MNKREFKSLFNYRMIFLDKITDNTDEFYSFTNDIKENTVDELIEQNDTNLEIQYNIQKRREMLDKAIKNYESGEFIRIFTIQLCRTITPKHNAYILLRRYNKINNLIYENVFGFSAALHGNTNSYFITVHSDEKRLKSHEIYQNYPEFIYEYDCTRWIKTNDDFKRLMDKIFTEYHAKVDNSLTYFISYEEELIYSNMKKYLFYNWDEWFKTVNLNVILIL